LKDDTIAKIHDRLRFNAFSNRKDVKDKYLLSGFIFCEKCKLALYGQTQKDGFKNYVYYRHATGNEKKCLPKPPFTQINAKMIEAAVFQALVENIADVPSFEAAIAESLPDDKMKKKLKAEIDNDKKVLKRIDQKLNKLVEWGLKGTLKEETMQKKETALISQRDLLLESLEDNEERYANMPDIESVKSDAEEIRRQLLWKYADVKSQAEFIRWQLRNEYSDPEHFEKMTFEEKRKLLHWVFDGKEPFSGDKYGIYINKEGKGKDAIIDYFLYGRVQGLRSIKGDDFDYMPPEQSNTDYKTKLSAGKGP